jgi:23S rRNA (cytidine1920-2'-O)/16S rRNA (cytidine1409-2'-O)-methyltransferase
MTGTHRTRLDEALMARGLAPSRSRARDMIRRSTVTVDGAIETRPAKMVSGGEAIAVDDPAAPYVSRAALKLIAGLDAFGFDTAGLTVLDLGASTGGFAQVLLERGAAHVIAVDVGHGEMDAALAADRRLTLVEGLNARELTKAHLGRRRVEAITADLSFISLKLALPPALLLAEPGTWGIFLVKPQFEAGRAALGKGGVVRDLTLARETAEGLAAWLGEQDGWRVAGLLPSPLTGGSGNQEFLLGARRD